MTYLQNPLAKHLIAGAFAPGDTIVVAHKGQGQGPKDDQLEFRRKAEEAASSGA